MTRAALFDMDNTLIAESSASLYLKHRFGKGEIGALDLARGAGAYLQFKLGVLDLERWTASMIREFAGWKEADLVDLGEDLFEAVIRHVIFPEARRVVAEHQEAGHTVAIVSGALHYIVKPMADHLGIDHVLCTHLETDDGVMTGRVIPPVCMDAGKIHWVRRWMETHHVDLARSWFYTDSITDTPLLDLVGHPVATNPDLLLYRRAVRRRWSVRLFDPPGSVRRPGG